MPNGILKNLNQQNYQNYILPLAAIIETIATKGASPGTTALQQQQLFQQKDAQEEERRQRELQRKLAESELVGSEKKRSMLEESERRQKALSEKLGIAKPEERSGIVSEYLQQNEPLEWYKQQQDLNERKMALEMAGRTASQKQRGEDIKGTRELRKEFQGDKRVNDFNEINRAFKNMESVWSKRDESGGKKRASIDQALITLYNKMLDPSSVVRESEYARTPDNAPLINRFMGRMQQVVEGGAGLTDADRQEILNTASNLYDSAENKYSEVLNTYASDALESNYDLNKIFTKQDIDLLYRKEKPEQNAQMELTQKNFSLNPQAGQQQTQTYPGAPPVGSVMGGYKYKGGNPNSPDSWELAK